MAMIDYGAILKVNDKFINKNLDDFLMKESDMGYEPKNKDIGGFVIAGDENFCLTFYKGCCEVYHNEKLINQIFASPFLSETIFNGDLPKVKIEHLDKEKQPWSDYEIITWREYIRYQLFYNYDLDDIIGNIDCVEYLTDKMLEDIKNHYPKHNMKYLRRLKQEIRDKYKCDSYTGRWKATWKFKVNKYEVIFGYGIDKDRRVWNRIKYDAYDFTDYEREVINEWFK